MRDTLCRSLPAGCHTPGQPGCRVCGRCMGSPGDCSVRQRLTADSEFAAVPAHRKVVPTALSCRGRGTERAELKARGSTGVSRLWSVCSPEHRLPVAVPRRSLRSPGGCVDLSCVSECRLPVRCAAKRSPARGRPRAALKSPGCLPAGTHCGSQQKRKNRNNQFSRHVSDNPWRTHNSCHRHRPHNRPNRTMPRNGLICQGLPLCNSPGICVRAPVGVGLQGLYCSGGLARLCTF